MFTLMFTFNLVLIRLHHFFFTRLSMSLVDDISIDSIPDPSLRIGGYLSFPLLDIP